MTIDDRGEDNSKRNGLEKAIKFISDDENHHTIK
jgi:hypothetical protein